MKQTDLNIKMTTDVKDFEKSLDRVKKSIEELNNTKIVVNIETRTIDKDKKWYQFWK